MIELKLLYVMILIFSFFKYKNYLNPINLLRGLEVAELKEEDMPMA
jgi:hypothetical protein